jgi:predicted DNA repair protein MutK
MSSGLAALLDDVATIAKLAAASLDDVGAAAGKASAKAAGVVIDDTAVTPRYLAGFTPERELPIIARIAKGSLKNKLLFILPAALILSGFLPWAITPILMVGGAYLCFEGFEKAAEEVREAVTGVEDELDEEVAELTSTEHEAQMVSGAIRTDFILSAEIMAIALAEVSQQSLGMQAVILAVVAFAITIGVYGVVGLIVKMDDIGLHLAKGSNPASRAFGLALVRFMPKLLAALTVVGTAAMIWVGGGIILHGLDVFGVSALPQFVHHLAEDAGHAAPFAGGLVEWLFNAIGSGIFGLAVGGIITAGNHLVVGRKAPH